MCHCVYQVVSARFQNSGLNAVEMIVFLRFINPALVSPFEYGLTQRALNNNQKRAVMIVSKILQVFYYYLYLILFIARQSQIVKH